MKQFRSVKFRLTLWYAFILTVFLAGFSFLMYAELSRALFRDTEKNMFLEEQRIEVSLVAYLQGKKELNIFPPPKIEKTSFLFPQEFQDALIKSIFNWENAQKRVNRSLFLLRIVGLDHSVILSNLEGWEKEIIFPDFERDSVFMEKGRSYQTIHFQKRPIRIYYHLVRIHNRPFFIIQVAKSLQDIESTLSRLALIIAVIVPGAVALACFAGWFFAKKFFAPVDQMIQQARKITAAYLKSRLPRTFTEDELDRLAETLNEMMDRIEASTRAVQEFSSDVSHELKTPLAIIRGEIDLALRRERSSEELQKTLGVIGEEVNGLIRLVDDLMFLVRNDARQINLQKKPIFLKSLIEQVISLHQERAKQKQIELSADIKKEPQIVGDEIYLKRLFANLIDNAIKFTSLYGKVTVHVQADPEKAVVTVEDTGMGIDPKVLEKIGTRFYRADQARAHEGAGLGLSIVKAICDSHRANVKINSVLGQGTRIVIELPLAWK